MPGPLVPIGIGVGSAVAGSLLRGGRAKPRNFSDFLSEFEAKHGPERFGLTRQQYQETLRTGATNIRGERDRGVTQGLTQLRQAGLGRSAAAGTVPLRAASASEQSFQQMLARLSALDANVAEQQKSNLRSQGIQAFQAQGQEDARVAAENAQADAQFGNILSTFVDPIENYYLLRDLQAIRSLSLQPSASDYSGRTDELFKTSEALGQFDLTLGG